ncbi:hypothetical protein [Brevundimonas sp.]|jgi:regulator of replication initiation timing|uniref:hypothetical protein n=1 Tax=Brevundimonas sp. TaxID=1871086 RepID=UPI002E12D8CE|nr:hypothetical protein [Brevundimonas sp.]
MAVSDQDLLIEVHRLAERVEDLRLHVETVLAEAHLTSLEAERGRRRIEAIKIRSETLT